MKTLSFFTNYFTRPFILMLLFFSASCYSLKSNPTYITPSEKYHIVKKGETLYSISKEYGISVDQLKLYNNLANDKIIIGQKLYFTPSTPTKSEYVTVRSIPESGYHVVQKGETVYRISKMYDIEIMDLVQINNLASFDIKVDQKIWLISDKIRVEKPKEEPEKPEAHEEESTAPQFMEEGIHIVVKGENLYRISLRYGMTVDQLKKLNGLTTNDIDVGQRLKIIKGEEKFAPPPPPPPAKETITVTIRDDLHLPLKGKILSEFGIRNKTVHNGIDIGAPVGEPIYAALDGKVVFVGVQRGYGNVVLLEHDDFIITVYAHNERNLVRLGDYVTKGQPIATVGQTGNASCPHLHFEYRVKGKAINPRDVIAEF